MREAAVRALVHRGQEVAGAVDRLAPLRAVDGSHVALVRSHEPRHRRDRRIPDVEPDRAAVVPKADRAGDLRERVEVESRVREARGRRVEERACTHREDAVERVEVVRAARAHAERVAISVGDERIDVLEGTEHRDPDARPVALRRAPPLVRHVELEIVDLEVTVHRDVASAGADDERQPRREERLSRRDLHIEGLRRLRREHALGHERHGGANRESECEVRVRPDERAERPAERGRAGGERVAGIARLVLQVGALAGVRVGHGRLIELGEDEMCGEAEVEPRRDPVRGGNRGEEDRRARLDEVVARGGGGVADGERERAIADHGRSERPDRDGQAIEAREVGRGGEERREERPCGVRHERKRFASPRRRGVVRVVGEEPGALELERVQEQVPAGIEARSALPREPRGIEVDRGAVIRLGDERGAASNGLRAVVRDLEAAGERGAGSAEDPRRKGHDGRRSDEAPHARSVHGSTLPRFHGCEVQQQPRIRYRGNPAHPSGFP